MLIECTGRFLSDGHLVLSPEMAENFEVGEMVRVRLEKLYDEPVTRHDNLSPEGRERFHLSENAREGEPSPAAKRFLERMEHADALGVPEDPRELGHAVLAQERMEKKYPCTE